jgi:hypothetical protein
VKDLHGINPLLDQKKYNGKKVAEEHVLMRLHDAMLCRPRTWLNDAVIQDYSFFLNKVANESEASVLFLSSPNKTTDAIARPCERVVLYIIARRAQIDIADLVSEI